MKIISLDRKSIKIKLATAFVITSIIPILLVNIIYYYNTSKLVQQNVESMTKANLEQTSAQNRTSKMSPIPMKIFCFRFIRMTIS